MLVLLGDCPGTTERESQVGSRWICHEGIRRSADYVGYAVLEEQVRNRDVGAKKLPLACDRLHDVAAVM